MRATIKELFLLTASLAALVGHADSGDSSPFLLDTAEGIRIAAEGEAIPIAYSPHWNGVASCSVTETGRAALVAAATDEGTVSWTPQGVGVHTLTHTAGDLTYTAQFAVLGDDVAVHAGTLETNQTDVVWRKELVHLIVEPVTVPLGVVLTIEPGTVVKFMPGTALTVPRVSPTSPYMCQLSGAIFTHAYDDTVGGDTLMDGDETIPVMGDYSLSGIFPNDGVTEYRYREPQTLPASVTSDTCLTGYRVYIVSNSVTVASGVTLTLQPGTILKFNSGCSMTVNGTLNAQGTRAQPIVFTSLKDDEFGGDTNGDGENTCPWAGDWARIYAGGTLNMNYCRIRYCNNNSDQGAIQGSGGTVLFDNGIIEASTYECVRMNSGKFTTHNSVFRDASMGFGYYGGSGVYVYNCVVADCTIACRASNKHFYNTVFYNCYTFLESTSSSCDHCVFYNEPGLGAQSATQVGSNGNIWGDPTFVDAANGDFRIQKGSPCINAGDAVNAPEFDYYGQPRDDRPDVGIYEAVGNLMSANDLAAVAVDVPAANSTVGDTLTVSYTVSNVGKQAVSGSWRDKVTLVSADGGYSIDLGTVVQSAALAVGARNTFNASFTVPTDAEGTWRVQVGVNVERDIYEGANITNNVATSEGTVEVSLLARAASDGFSGTATKGAPASAKFALDGAEPMVARINAPAGTVVYFGSGFMPSASSHSARAVVGADGGLIGIPAGVTSAYLLVETTSSNGAAFTMTLEPAALAVQSVSPATLPYTGTTGLVIDGANFAEGCRVELGSVQFAATIVSPTRLTAQIDCSRLTAGAAYGVKVIAADGATATLPNAVTVAKVPAAPKLSATLDAPASVRRGRTLTVYIDYENVGNADLPAPIFELISEGQVFKIDGAVYTNSVKVMGLSAEAPVGTLRPGEPQRIGIPVTILAENVKWKLRSYHAAQEGARNTRLLLSEFYNPEWALYPVSNQTAAVAAVRSRLGSTYAEFYTNLGAWISDTGSTEMDYASVSESFAQQVFIEAHDEVERGIPTQSVSRAAKRFLSLPKTTWEDVNVEWKPILEGTPQGSVWKWVGGAPWWERVVEGNDVKTPIDTTSDTFIICHGNLNSIFEPWVLEMASKLSTHGNVLAVNWDKDAAVWAGLPHKTAEKIPGVANEALRELTLPKLGIIPANTILIGHSHGGHVTGRIVASWPGSPMFKRLVGLDTSTTDWGVHGEIGWIDRVRERCGQVEFYKSSWNLSLGDGKHAASHPLRQMYGHFNFALSVAGDFYERTTAMEISPRHGYAHEWFTDTINDASFENLGFNFAGDLSWRLLCGNKTDIPSPGAGRLAGVIRGNALELLSEIRDVDASGARMPWRYAETVLNQSGNKPMEALRNAIAMTHECDATIAVGYLPNEIKGNQMISFKVKENADNYSVDFAKMRGVQATADGLRERMNVLAWLVDVEGLETVTDAGNCDKWSYTDLTNYLHVAGEARYVRLIGVGVGNYNLESALKIDDGYVATSFANNLFGEDRPLSYEENGEKKHRRLLLVVGSGVPRFGAEEAITRPEHDLYIENNYAIKPVTVESGLNAVISREIAIVRSIAKVSSVSARTYDATKIEPSGTALMDGEAVVIETDANGNWSIGLNGYRSETDGEGFINLYRFSCDEAILGVDSDAAFKTVNLNAVRARGILPEGVDGKRYTVRLDVYSAATNDYATCILDVRRKPEEPEPEDEDEDGSTEPKSCDPNEMVGEEGIGERRLVMPGQELTYTIYFENKSDAEAAAACVEVVNPLNEWLDWSSLTMIDVGFNNHVDSGLNGKHEGESEKALDGTNTTVRTEFAVNEETGVAEWYLRIIDPNGDSEGWPLDMTGGFLPPNDDTHCGEGYIRYSIRVRDDAPMNVVITNSATIIFDHFNDPIETDPAWWNTVGRQDWIDVATDFVGAAKGVVTSKTDAKTGVTTLTAKPSNKNSLFAYWIGPDGEKAGFGATLNVKAATQGGKYTAVFTTKTACAKPSLDKSNAFAKGGAQMFNSVVGVAASDRFVVPDACYPVKFSVKGMPKGLKVNAASGAITGVPAKAGKYTATVTVTSVANAKKKVTVKVPITIAKLPKWTYGTFTGLASPNDARDLFENGSSDENDVVGSAKMTIAATGKMTLNVLVCGTNWTASASGFAATSDCGNERYDVKFTAKAKIGKTTLSRSFALTLDRQSYYDDANGGATVALDTAFYDSPVFIGTGLYMKRYMWKDSGAAAWLAPYTGAYTYYTADNEKLTLTVAANGTVKVAGTLANGRKLSLSTYVVLAGDGWDIPCVLVYAPATTAKVKVGKTTRTVKYGEFFEQVMLDNHYSPPEPGYGTAYRNAGLKPSAEGSGTGTFAYSPAYGQAGSNKVVTVTAKPAKNSVFAYWTRNGEIVSYSPTYKVTMLGGDDTSLWAEFRLKSDFNDVNLAPWWEDADGNELEKTEIAEILKWRLFTGLKTTLKFCVDDDVRPVKFSATGLPKGMSLNATTGVLSGIPTAASSGTIKITVASTANTKKKVTQSFKWQVRKLRTFARGTFKGTLEIAFREKSGQYWDDELEEFVDTWVVTNSVEKTLTLIVGANGKASGKVISDGKTYVVSTACYSSYSDESRFTDAYDPAGAGKKTWEDETFTAVGTISCGSMKWPISLTVRETGDMNPVATKATRATDVNPKGYGAWRLDTLMTIEGDIGDISISSELKRIK